MIFCWLYTRYLRLYTRYPRMRRYVRAMEGLGAAPLLWLMMIAMVCILYPMIDHYRGVHIRCGCGLEVKTEKRVAKYGPGFMADLDPRTNRSVIDELEASHPSLAAKFLFRQEERGQRCTTTPGLFTVHHSNTIWQQAKVGQTTFLIYGAYHDDRDKEGPLVRVLLMSDSNWPSTPTCHLWHENDVSPVATRALRIEYIHWQYPKSDHWLPYIVTCRGFTDGRKASVVALVSSHCEQATNAVRIVPNTPHLPKRDLALCHKFIFNPTRDFSIRLIEWLEALRAWGVDQVTIYESEAHPNVDRVIQHYQRTGFLKIMAWRNPGHQPNIPHLQRLWYDTQRYSLFTTENLVYTDCLLRHLGSHRYVAVWDIDEFLLPTGYDTIPQLIDAAKESARQQGYHPPTSYLAKSAYFFDNESEASSSSGASESFHMLNHVKRTVKLNPPLVHTKGIHDTSLALGLHAHFALLNIHGEVNRELDIYHFYPSTEGLLAHYRDRCQGENQTDCSEVFRPFQQRDTTMWLHKEAIVNKAQDVIQRLHL